MLVTCGHLQVSQKTQILEIQREMLVNTIMEHQEVMERRGSFTALKMPQCTSLAGKRGEMRSARDQVQMWQGAQ